MFQQLAHFSRAAHSPAVSRRATVRRQPAVCRCKSRRRQHAASHHSPRSVRKEALNVKSGPRRWLRSSAAVTSPSVRAQADTRLHASSPPPRPVEHARTSSKLTSGCKLWDVGVGVAERGKGYNCQRDGHADTRCPLSRGLTG